MPQLGSRPRTLTIGLVVAAAAFLTSAAPAALAATIAPSPSSAGGLYSLPVPTVTTVVHNAAHATVTSVVVGSTVHPWLQVSGSGSTPTGGVTIYEYHNVNCSGSWYSNTAEGLGAGGSIDASYLPFTSNDAAAVSYKVHYNGNLYYAAADGPCAGATFTKANPVVQLQVHDAAHHVVTSVSYGTSVHGYVEVGGAVDTPTGTASISRFPSSDCSGIGTAIGASALAGDGTLDSSYQWTFAAPGTYSFRAYYQGDSTYNAKTSACVTFTVTKATPTFTTTLHDASHAVPDYVLVGDLVHASALLTSTVGTPTGSVKVYRYSDAACTVIENPQTITAATTMDPAGQALTWAAPRTESWRLTYMGDTYFNSVAGPCLAMQWRATPTVAATIHDAGHAAVTTVHVGSPVHLAATVSRGFGTPTGDVQFRVSTGGTCANPQPFGTKTLSNGTIDVAASAYVPAAAGTYSFQASYGGSPSYAPAISTCQVLTVTAAPVATAAPKAGSTPGPTEPATPQPSASVAPSPAPTEGPGSPAPAASTSSASAPGPSVAPVGAVLQAPAGTDGSGPGLGVVLAGLLLLLIVALVVARWIRGMRRT